MVQRSKPPLPLATGSKGRPRLGTRANPSDPTPIEILADMCQAFGIDPIYITSQKRIQANVKYRRLYCYLTAVLSSARSDEKAELVNIHRGTYFYHAKKCVGWFKSCDQELLSVWGIYLESSKLWNKHFKRKQQQNGNHKS
jgi:hypothetical protein